MNSTKQEIKLSPTKQATKRLLKRCGKWNNPDEGESFFCGRKANHPGSCNRFPDAEEQGFKAAGALKVVMQAIHELKEKLNSKIRLRDKYMPQRMLVRCLGNTVGATNGCGEWIPVGQIVYIQTHWYTPPSGCSGGDYWNNGEGQFICPKCGVENRLYERPQVEALREYFKEVQSVYGRN